LAGLLTRALPLVTVDEPLFITVAETARLLAVSDDLVYDLVARRELPSVTLGRRLRIPRRAIDLVLERALDGFDPGAVVQDLSPPAATTRARARADGSPVDERHLR
jgi:excisionase family DNA binding protein